MLIWFYVANIKSVDRLCRMKSEYDQKLHKFYRLQINLLHREEGTLNTDSNNTSKKTGFLFHSKIGHLRNRITSKQRRINVDATSFHRCFNIWAAARYFQQCDVCDQQSLRSACAYAQSDQSLCYSLEYSMSVKLLTEQNLKFLGLKGGCTDSSESTLVKKTTLQITRNPTHNLSKTKNEQPRDFQQWGILTRVDMDEHVLPPFKLRNSKKCSVSSVILIEHLSD